MVGLDPPYGDRCTPHHTPRGWAAIRAAAGGIESWGPSSTVRPSPPPARRGRGDPAVVNRGAVADASPPGPAEGAPTGHPWRWSLLLGLALFVVYSINGREI